MSTCELNQIFLGEVSSIQNYGAFVKIPGCRQQGLIHKSQVSSVRIDEMSDVLQRGERVWCKVINIDEDGKIGLSMKLVNQGNGRDLDPNGITLDEDERRRRTLVPREKKAIELQAVLNTTCSKCGTKGHMASDCFTTPDGKKYELLPELEEEVLPPHPAEILEPQERLEKIEKLVKMKKLKKRKKSKKSKHQSSDNSSDDSSSDEKRKKKKKKRSKEVKKKKRKHSESSSDSSDNVVREKHSKKCKHSRSKYSD